VNEPRIIAAGPLSTHERGTLPFRIVLREFLDENGRVTQYVVHQQVLSQDLDTYSFGQGSYFSVASYVNLDADYEASRRKEFREATTRFADRVLRHANSDPTPANCTEVAMMDNAREYGSKRP
jgi:hypothetical protein